jgi:hypothetical protein
MGAYLCMVPFISVLNFCMALSQFCPRLQLLVDSLPCFMALFQGYLSLQEEPKFKASMGYLDPVSKKKKKKTVSGRLNHSPQRYPYSLECVTLRDRGTFLLFIAMNVDTLNASLNHNVITCLFMTGSLCLTHCP